MADAPAEREIPATERTEREVTAAVVREKGSFELGPALLGPPRDDEVVVRIVAAGLCHTDLVVRDQVYPVPLPVVLGHEGAGVVEAVGAAVEKVAPGDHVAVSFLPCGRCRPCFDGSPASCANFNAVNFAGRRLDGSHALRLADGDSGGILHDRFFGQSSFATHAVTNERNTVKVRPDAPLELLGPLGCGIQTGAGTVLRALNVGVGSTFAVMGAGAVGLSAVMAARVAGAVTIIAVDVLPSRLELAAELGATHTVNGREQDAVEEIGRITGEGVDYALDTTGLPPLIGQMIQALRQRGTAAVLGASAEDAVVGVPANAFMQSCKTLMGVVEGNSVPDVFVPQLLDLYMQGRFPFDRLVTFYDFDQINEAAADAAAGRAVKPILRMG
ncbi:NAD(P)-dependent alcohol dehydrogenase [Streptomyces sp. NPDC012461]|jgi:aryl-alcohol dehydrogenase|uniref:NAD(P)-dependent alcohol dehydrogenase n=3 Tax=Streptomyces TaxID=1883 RepID=UPI0013DC225B|nr:NAD(P)-dependent alcohol dehydrogenase [Streptomyces sp. SID9913]MBM7090889.1 NAD(P)-dependent alcohol dehydrogenase [Streptomyces sp. S12]NED20368.1 NAD(P)-dependent alcohol dehydrogenase [Streptomyces sp. SID9913]